MNFNFKEILELFKGHWRFLAFILLVGALVSYFVIVPIAESYFGSERQSCSKCLDENADLVNRIIAINHLIADYEVSKAKKEILERQATQMMVEEDTIVTQEIIIPLNEEIDSTQKNIIDEISRLSKVD